MKPATLFERFAASPARLDDLARVEALLRSRYKISEGDLVLVSEDPGSKPGYPPVETNIVFWIGEIRYRLRIFAPVCEFTVEDLPVGWLLPALVDNGDADCC